MGQVNKNTKIRFITLVFLFAAVFNAASILPAHGKRICVRNALGDQLERADTVFWGEVLIPEVKVHGEGDQAERAVLFQVLKAYKGVSPHEKIEVFVSIQGRFENGEQGLVIARTWRGPKIIGQCGNSDQ